MYSTHFCHAPSAGGGGNMVLKTILELATSLGVLRDDFDIVCVKIYTFRNTN